MRTMAETANFYEQPEVKFMQALYPRAYAHGFISDNRRVVPLEVLEKLPTNPRPMEIIAMWAKLTGENIDVAYRSLANAYLRLAGIRR